MRSTMLSLVAAAIIAVAAAKCPSGCSGHGKCGKTELCTCEDGYVGTDCASRACPYGVSWTIADAAAGVTPGGRGLGGIHPYTECSSVGDCDYSTGTCKCIAGFEGRGCRRRTCANDCSGHGKCYNNNEIARNHTAISGAVFNSQFRDFLATRQCVCDRGFSGIDCSERMCPTGDDPVTDCATTAATHEMIQRIYVRMASVPEATCTACDVATATCAHMSECNHLTSGHSFCTENTRWYANEATCAAASLTVRGNFVIPTSASVITSTAHATKKIIRSAGSFILAGYEVGDTIKLDQKATGSTAGCAPLAGGNTPKFFTVKTVVALELTVNEAFPATVADEAVSGDCIVSKEAIGSHGNCKAKTGHVLATTSNGIDNTLWGYIALKYTDMFGGVYKTRPILLSNECDAMQFLTGGNLAFDNPVTNSHLQYGGLGAVKTLATNGQTAIPTSAVTITTSTFVAVGSISTILASGGGFIAAGYKVGDVVTLAPGSSVACAPLDAFGGSPGITTALFTIRSLTTTTMTFTTAFATTANEDTGGHCIVSRAMEVSRLKSQHAAGASTDTTTPYDQIRNGRKLYIADRIRDALQGLPNFAIPKVNVTNYYQDNANAKTMFSNVFDVTFTHKTNAGRQPLMECIYKHEQACAGAFPRLFNSGMVDGGTNNAGAALPVSDGASNGAKVATNGASCSGTACNSKYVGNWGSVNTVSCTVEEVLPGTKTYEENVECSNRGTCDTSTGQCTCYEGHTGEACSEQTVFF